MPMTPEQREAKIPGILRPPVSNQGTIGRDGKTLDQSELEFKPMVRRLANPCDKTVI